MTNELLQLSGIRFSFNHKCLGSYPSNRENMKKIFLQKIHRDLNPCQQNSSKCSDALAVSAKLFLERSYFKASTG